MSCRFGFGPGDNTEAQTVAQRPGLHFCRHGCCLNEGIGCSLNLVRMLPTVGIGGWSHQRRPRRRTRTTGGNQISQMTPAANQINAHEGEQSRRESDPEKNQIHQPYAGGKNHIPRLRAAGTTNPGAPHTAGITRFQTATDTPPPTLREDVHQAVTRAKEKKKESERPRASLSALITNCPVGGMPPAPPPQPTI
jgi:hypothetical protein